MEALFQGTVARSLRPIQTGPHLRVGPHSLQTGLDLLPSGLVVPPLPYAAALGLATLSLVAALYVLGPPVTQRQVVAFTPWMVAGGILHVLYQIGAVPAVAAPLFSAPSVYVVTFVFVGAVWVGSTYLAGTQPAERTARDVGLVGLAVTLALAAVAYWQALELTDDPVSLAWPVVGVLAALAVFAPVSYLLKRRRPEAVSRAGMAGAAAVYAHVLDGVSTAIGVDLLGTAERTPLPRYIMEFAGTLPTAPLLGRGWLFVVVKFAVAVVIVTLLTDYAREEPDEGNLLLAFVTALGLGPAANNLFLFLMGGPV